MASKVENFIVRMAIAIIMVSTMDQVSARVQHHPNISDVDRLIKDKRANYNVFLRPKINQSEPVVIHMAFDLIAIRDFDEVKERFSVMGTIYMAWRDERMAWDPEEYGNLRTIITEHRDFWVPTLILVNAFDRFEKVGHEDFWPVRFFPEGAVLFQPGQVFTTTCSVNVELYPFDTQTCQLLYSVWGHYKFEIILKSLENFDKVSLTYYGSNGEWDLIDTHAGLMTENVFSFEFVIKRKPLFIVVNTLIPIIFMSFLNILAFLIPVDSGERLSYSITVFLAVAVFLTIIGDFLPKTATNIAVLCYYLVSVLALSIAIIVGSILSMKIHVRNDDKEVSGFWISLVSLIKCRPCPPRKHNMYEKIRDPSPKRSFNSDVTLYKGKIDGNIAVITNGIVLDQNRLYMDEITRQGKNRDRLNRLDREKDLEPKEEFLEQTDGRTYTWKDVSRVLDVLFLGFSLIALASCTATFFIYTMS